MTLRHHRRHEVGAAAEAEPVRAGAAPEMTPAGVAGADDLVLLVHADDMAVAERYRSELLGHGIPAVVQGEPPGESPDAGVGVPVLVPEALADEAAERIAELESSRPEEGHVVDDDFDEETGDLEDVPNKDRGNRAEGLGDSDEELDEDEDDDLDEDDWDDDDWDDDDWDDEDDEDDEDENGL